MYCGSAVCLPWSHHLKNLVSSIHLETNIFLKQKNCCKFCNFNDWLIVNKNAFSFSKIGSPWIVDLLEAIHNICTMDLYLVWKCSTQLWMWLLVLWIEQWMLYYHTFKHNPVISKRSTYMERHQYECNANQIKHLYYCYSQNKTLSKTNLKKEHKFAIILYWIYWHEY